jgi:hypothetical protein
LRGFFALRGALFFLLVGEKMNTLTLAGLMRSWVLDCLGVCCAGLSAYVVDLLCGLLCFALLCFALLCFALLCFALLCFALLCFVCAGFACV